MLTMIRIFIVIFVFSIRNSIPASVLINSDIDVYNQGAAESYYTNVWVVRVSGGNDRAKSVATELGFDSLAEVSEGLPNFYSFHNHSEYPTSKMEHADKNLTRKLRENSEIEWTEQQMVFNVVPTIELPSLPTSEKSLYVEDETMPTKTRMIHSCIHMNDKYWPQQYYIQDCRKNKPHHNLNVVPVWIQHGLSGKNIKVLVIDDGIETKHSDLIDNYEPALGLDLQDNDTEPDPVHLWGHKFTHGTRCAGVIGMKANNAVCGVGIAPSVTLGAVRLFGPKPISDKEIAKALLFKFNEIHIVSNSWTIRGNGKSHWFPGLLSLSALKTGITQGRNGKGIIYVFSSGSSKVNGENCGKDRFRNSIYVIPVASSDYRGKVTIFSERCATIMATTYSSGSHKYNVVSTDIGNGCTTDHGGTSASAPMVSGAIALALEANPDLTWRDVQHLLAWTGQVAPLQNNPPGTWTKNGAGFYVSHDFGFGMLDINELVEKAKRFQNVPPLNVCVTRVKLWKFDYLCLSGDLNGVDREYSQADPMESRLFQNGIKVTLTSDGCEGDPSEVMYLEHVQVNLSLSFPRRGDLYIALTSPSGTESTLLEPRSFDSYAFGISAWTFRSVRMWGENPRGSWTIRIVSKSNRSGMRNAVKNAWSTVKNVASMMGGLDKCRYGELKELHLILYGTSGKRKPPHYNAGPRPYHNFTLPS